MRPVLFLLSIASVLAGAGTKSNLTYLLYANDDSGCWVWARTWTTTPTSAVPM